MSRPTNPRGKKFAWSPSALSDYISCPLQYAHKRFYETIKFVETEPMRQGNIEHRHLELRLRDKTPLPAGYDRGEKYCRVIEQAAEGGELIAEQELAISQDLKFVNWFSKEAWGRCKIDVTMLTGGRAYVTDWKTGKVKDDVLQLKINALFLSLKYPDIMQFRPRYIWLKYDTVTPENYYIGIDEIPGIWGEILTIIKRMENAWRTEDFSPRPSGLCKRWCSCTECTYCGRGGR